MMQHIYDGLNAKAIRQRLAAGVTKEEILQSIAIGFEDIVEDYNKEQEEKRKKEMEKTKIAEARDQARETLVAAAVAYLKVLGYSVDEESIKSVNKMLKNIEDNKIPMGLIKYFL